MKTSSMKVCVVIGVAALFASNLAWPGSASEQPRALAPQPLMIIPGRAGYGMDTVAGSGRHLDPPDTAVYRVTSLAAVGPGTLTECIEASMPRVCVFEVSGTIDLSRDASRKELNLKHPFITIAGQTAPSPGITVKGKTLRIEAHDVLIQHIRFRVGDDPDLTTSRHPDSRDAVTIVGKKSDLRRRPYNVVIDHCSLSWATDEVLSVKDTASYLTISNTIISEGLENSLHPKGGHSKGMIASGNFQTISRNLFAHVRDRAPLDTSPNSMLINNVLHNTKHMTFAPLSNSEVYSVNNLRRNTHVQGNVRSFGENFTATSEHIGKWGAALSGVGSKSRFYLADNICNGSDTACQVGLPKGLEGAGAPVFHTAMEVWPSGVTKRKVLRNVGARPRDRDSVDQRIIRDARQNKGRIKDCVAGAPIYFPSGLVALTTARNFSLITITSKFCYANRFKGQVIEIRSAKGKRQRRAIIKHTCGKAEKVSLLVEPPLTEKLNQGSTFRIENNCDNNAGGWPELEPGYRELVLPEHINDVTDSGYTRLEEYLHEYYSEVEFQSGS